MDKHEFDILSAGDALGALSDDDRQAYRRALVDHPDWADDAREDAETAASLADLPGEVMPPAHVLEDVLARIDATSASTEPDAPAQPHRSDSTMEPMPGRSPRRRRWFALAASVVLVAGIGIGASVIVQQATRPAYVTALDRIESAPDAQQATADVAGGGTATLHWSASEGQAVIVADDLPSLSDDQTYELWYVRGETPISAGVFDATGPTTTALLEPGMKPGDVVAVTVEREGGSPDGKPTSEPIVVIPTA
ncbi:anti-sigma factor domain-containing protein [Microbacterium sp. NPDC057659]|uniref:anti-sigma factor n=1 Tax=Microbacterium sp. NPDC057659 TaxID=3346198 RepID=UPI00366B2904